VSVSAPWFTADTVTTDGELSFCSARINAMKPLLLWT